VLGFADHYVSHADLQAFTAAVVADGVDAALSAYAQHPPPSDLAAQRDWIDHCYADETVTDIVAALRGHDTDPANDAADLIATRSPVALAVTLASIRRAAAYDTLAETLVTEYRVSCAAARSHDLVEGIRAQVVDKDRNPKWSPVSLAAVTDEDVESYFAPADPDLTFYESEDT
jgi:enoyl-CoA hydratase